ncbi:RagB/SusD family nutrient uptake outer membrane protein [Spirosoma sp. HMF3257]|uniref:RagB/SusD family nutrient uptake outer membrane protein n=1 Tax=Spirosoma telluris TaxID=2183553 RepID=A0A327NHK9_9BACT|nr:RagB/SusD family nutrient uptake outer membrane protein [Spirosoma telluris]RAI73496.1 RagB/SusD family nutrient uptake outer membrane protein [Spirosoma telluris]
MKISLFALILSACLLGACQDVSLDQVPQTERSEANFYQTNADFYNAIVGVYGALKLTGIVEKGSGSYLYMTELVSDNTDTGQARGGTATELYYFEDFNFALSSTTISNAWTSHYAGIARTNSILDRLAAVNIPQASKDRFEGEAKFMRALFYFNLVRFFGDVQLATHEITSPYGANSLPRSPAADVYALIISDLKTAETKLPTTIPASEAGRASVWAAKSLLGKVYLTLKQYDNAATKLKEVIDGNVFSLMPKYADIFPATTSFVNNKEYIFAVQYKSGQVGQGSDLWSNWAAVNASVALLGAGGGTGGGFNRPTADMDAAYEAGDLRKDASMLNSYKAANGTTVNERYVVKFRQQGALNQDSDVDFPLLRYADVLLMYGETLNELGRTSEGLTYLNQIRKRAGLADKMDLSQADFRLAMEQERRVELAFEGHRWFDLVRTGRFIPVMTTKGYKVKDFNQLYLIPQREIDLNKAITQNTGY